MKSIHWSNARIRYTALLVIFFIVSLFSFPLIADTRFAHLIMSASFIVTVLVAFMGGTIAGLVSALLFIFIFGSALFFVHLTETDLFPSLEQLPLTSFLLVGLVLVIVVFLAGKLHDVAKQTELEMIRMGKELTEYASVDRETGFDNRYRLERELMTELSKAQRYDSFFSLIVLHLDYYEKFRSLYGGKEATYLVKTLAQRLEKVMRVVDRKYRYEEGQFALILPYTPEEGVDVVLEKLQRVLQTHTLLNGNEVTLRFLVSTYTFDREEERTAETLLRDLESEMKTRVLGA